MRVQRPALVSCIALLGLGASPLPPQTTAICGYVYGVHGSWMASNPTVPKLQLGQAIYAGQSIEVSPGAPGSYIDIGYVNGKAVALDCDKDPASCKSAYTVAPLTPGSSLRQRAMDAVNHLFNHGPVPVVFAMSRGGESAEGPQEAVLSMDQGHLDPTPALHDLSAGDYSLSLRAVPDSGGAPIRLRCKWNPPAAQCAADNRLTAGLFALTVSTDSGVAGSPVAVLLTPPTHFEALTDSFEELKSVPQSWPKDTRPETIHYFRTAALDALNQPSQVP